MLLRILLLTLISVPMFAYQNTHAHHQHQCECEMPAHLFARKSAATADMVISEIMQNPAAVSDTSGEWFEVFNPGDVAVNLQGWTIRDDGSDSHTISATLMIPARGYAVLGRNSDASSNGGIAVDYQYSGISLANGADELLLLRADSTVADAVRWDGGSAWPSPTGASMELSDANADNSLPASWTTATTAIGSGDFGTPGTGPNAGSAVANVVISEIMQNPAAVTDSNGEWFEIHNPGVSSLNLNGWSFRDQANDSFTVTSDVIVTSGGFAVFGRNGNSATNGGVTLDFVYGTAMQLANASDSLLAVRPDGTVADEVAYTSSSPWPNANGASMALTDLASDNALGQNWALSTTSISGGDFATPGSGPGTPSGGNSAPVVNAGSDVAFIFDGQTLQISLDATVTDGDSDPLTYAWTLISGNAANVTVLSPTSEDTLVNLSGLGVYSFRLTADDGSAAVADDVNVTLREPATTGSFNVYFGNLHAHSSYSDGNKSNDPNTAGVAAALRYARDQAGLDYLLVSDHNHATAGMARLDYQSGVIEANTVNDESANFTALYGMEWGTISTGGHVIMASDSLWGWEDNNYDVFVAKGDYNALFNQINTANTFGQLCHPATDQFSGIFSSSYNAAWDQAISLVTVVSGPAFAQATDLSEPASSTYISRYNDLLLKGYHLGPTGDQDTHYANWGLANEQRTAVLAPANSRTDIMDALKAGRTYAVQDRNIVIAYNATQAGNDYALASVLTANVGESIDLSVVVDDPDGEVVSTINLKTGTVGGSSVTTLQSGSGSFLNYAFSGNTSNTKHFIYAEITQADGQRAWTAPIWIEVGTGTTPPANLSPNAGFDFIVADLQVSFSDQSSDSDGSIVGYSWDFGDGSSASSSNPSHTFAATGTYNVSLTVTDDDGARASLSRQVSVVAPSSGNVSETYQGSLTRYASVTYTIDAAQAGVISLDCSWSQSRRDLDLFLFDAAGNEVARAESTNNPETLTFNTAGNAGTYTLLIENYTRRTTDYVLQVDVTTVSPKLRQAQLGQVGSR